MSIYREIQILAAVDNTVTETGESGPHVTFVDEINPDHSQMMVCLNVTAVSGTNPRMDLEVTMDILAAAGAVQHELGQFRRVTAVGHRYMLVQASLKNISIHHTIQGTNPSFSFGMTVIRL